MKLTHGSMDSWWWLDDWLWSDVHCFCDIYYAARRDEVNRITQG